MFRICIEHDLAFKCTIISEPMLYPSDAHATSKDQGYRIKDY